MNLIPKIAEMLGVGLNEEFRVVTPANIEKTCRFYERGNGVVYLEKYNDAFNQWTQENTDEIGRIVVGSYKVEKLPFAPKELDEYWFLGTFNGEPKIYSTFWKTETGDNIMEHYARKYCGNVFRTKSEAEAHKYEIYKKLTGREWKQ